MNNQVTIRNYKGTDYAQVQKICIATGSEAAMQKQAFADMLLTAFCNYYIEYEPENCFVADDDGLVVGYILCAENAEKWAAIFQEKYISTLDTDELKGFCAGLMKSPVEYAAEYPAHLHIDILPKYQHKGIGTMLTNELCRHLKDKGICGIMLSVASDNIGGIKFYKKYGFEVLAETKHEVIMGYSLQK